MVVATTRPSSLSEAALISSIRSPSGLEVQTVFLSWALFFIDDGIRCFYDGPSGSVVLLQLDYKEIRIVLFEVEDVLNIRPTEGIDTLRVISYYTDILMNSRQLFGDEVLGEVGILKLIHHHIFEPLLVFIQYIGVISEKAHWY